MAKPAVALYASAGEKLRRYAVDVTAGTLTPGPEVVLADAVQYAWPHPTRPLLYVASGSRLASVDNQLVAYK